MVVFRDLKDILNFNANDAGSSAWAFGSILMLMAIVDRAFGGSRARKLRTVFPERGLKGEKVVVTAVRYLDIILANAGSRSGSREMWMVDIEVGCLAGVGTLLHARS